jgi:hypothetical protein
MWYKNNHQINVSLIKIFDEHFVKKNQISFLQNTLERISPPRLDILCFRHFAVSSGCCSETEVSEQLYLYLDNCIEAFDNNSYQFRTIRQSLWALARNRRIDHG